MKSIFVRALPVCLGFMLVAGCRPAETGAPSPQPSLPSPTGSSVLPTPAAPGDQVTWRGLAVTMDSAEITDSFVTEFGPVRLPPAGQEFLWVHLTAEDTGSTETELPGPAHFSALYAQSEFKPGYGHRQGYPDYTDLATPLFPAQQADGWLRFDVPVGAELQDLSFVFLPESLHVAVSPQSPEYPWSQEFATYVWSCAP